MKWIITNSITVLIVLIVLTTVVQAQEHPPDFPVEIEPEMEYPEMDDDVTMLQITPRYEHIELEPGDTETTTYFQ